MECNKDEAARAKALAERKLTDKDFFGAKKLIMKAQKLSKQVDDIDILKMLTVCDVHCAAGAKKNVQIDWYGILQVPETADDAQIKKQYHKLALLLHPDKNKFGGAEAAFRLVEEANKILTDRSERYLYDMKRVGATQTTFWTICPSCSTRYQYYISALKKALCCQSCLKQFIAHDVMDQSVPYGAKEQSDGAVVESSEPSISETSSDSEEERAVVESCEPSISEISSDREGERAVVESSISEASSDSEEEIDDHGPAADGSVPGQRSRQKQEVKFSEDNVDDDFLNSPCLKRLRKSGLFCGDDSKKSTKRDEEIAGHNGIADGGNSCSRTEDERDGAPCREKTLNEIEEMEKQRGPVWLHAWLGHRNRSPRRPKRHSMYEEEDGLVGKDPIPPPVVSYDKEDPPMVVGSTYADMKQFKLALSQHAIKHGFEFDIEKSDPRRMRVYCSRKVEEGCRWRLHASTMADKVTVKVKRNPHGHKCTTAKRGREVKHATQFWVCEVVKDWLSEDSRQGATALQAKIKEKYKVEVPYNRVYAGKQLAHMKLFGNNWDSSFDNLFRFKAEVESSCPGSFVVIDHHKIQEKFRFNRLFFAMKPCIDGFLRGCRPYLAIDSTLLTGKYKGQLACACAVDGHNWMYPVAFGVMDSETCENWTWFMERLRDAIGTPHGLAISTDAGQSVMAGVEEVFPLAEHRECMTDLVSNFKKMYSGKVFDDHLWAAAYSWSPYFFDKHWKAMDEARPDAMDYIRQHHKKIWTRSKFLTHCKVDYVTNNLVESFNSWIESFKGLDLDDLMDKIRQLLMEKWDARRTASRKFEGVVLPHIMKKLEEESFSLDMDVSRCSDEVAEVSVKGSNDFKCVVNLQQKTCSCRKFQVSGIPCLHAIAFITSLREPLENYIDPYFSVEKFRSAYVDLIPALTDKSQWQQSDHGFFMHPPLKSVAGKNKRFKGCSEVSSSTSRKKGQHRCPICQGYGHHWHTCKDGDPADIAAMLAERGPPKKKKKKSIKISS